MIVSGRREREQRPSRSRRAALMPPTSLRASRPAASSRPCMIAIGGGGDPGTYTSTGSTRSTPPAVAGVPSQRRSPAQSPPPQASVPTATSAFGAGITCQVRSSGIRIGAVTGPGDEQHVGVAGRVGEEEAEPLDVVVGVPQRLDLPLLGAVRAAVDVAHVDRTAQRPRALAERRAHGSTDPLSRSAADDQRCARARAPSHSRG